MPEREQPRAGFAILEGDALAVLRTLPDESVHCCVTSPPYWGLRDYGVAGQLGLEKTPEEYVAGMVAVFAEVRRVLRADGTCWINLGDSYATPQGRRNGNFAEWAKGHESAKNGGRRVQPEDTPLRPIVAGLKPKDLVGIPWRVAFALQADGWYLRSDIIWHKPNPMPESVTDRPTKAHEYIFLLSKSERYAYDASAIAERTLQPVGSPERTGQIKSTVFNHGGTLGTNQGAETRNKRTVWTVSTCPTPEAHFATYPPDLIEPCILAGCPEGGTVLDPFAGAGTTGLACLKNGRRVILIELNPEYIAISENRARKYYPLLMEIA